MIRGVAITRGVSSALPDCELTHLERVPIDIVRARAQHASYESALAVAGYRVERLPGSDALPDCVFVEDIAVVLPELAVMTRPGAESRRAESPAVAAALAPHRQIRCIESPGTIDGGDVLVAGRQVLVGRSSRTNASGIEQLQRMLGRHGYRVCPIDVAGCLHLKSAVTAIEDDVLLVNPEWIDRRAVEGFEIETVDPLEPHAANVLRLHDRVIFPAAFPRTAAIFRRRRIAVQLVEVDELAKAEGAVTCCSLIVDASQ
jgi:dimethylargininase